MNLDANEQGTLAGRVEALKAATEIADGRLQDSGVTLANAIVTKANERLRHGTDHLLVALLGATGSGKSSLTNALALDDVALAGVRRPTTSSTLACVWGLDDAGPLLDWLGVQSRHQVPSESADLDGLVILDVPDHDSVEVSHRLEMEQIAEHADLMVWVTDPQKYADEALHQYLRRLSHHGASILVVLNKVDLLSDRELQLCRNDLRRLLDQDGLKQSRILAASTQSGDGIIEVRTVIAQRLKGQEAAMTRLEADVAVAATDLFVSATGGKARSATSKPAQIGAVKLATDVATAMGAEPLADLAAKGYSRDAQAATGWPFTRWARTLRPHPLRKFHLDGSSSGRSSLAPTSSGQRTRIDNAIRDAAESASEGLPDPWPRRIRAIARPDQDELFDRLDLALGTAVRTTRPRQPRWWRVAGLAQWVLTLAVLVGAVWLCILAGAAWLQLPEVPTPKLLAIPLPTLLLVGGAASGWLLAMIARVFCGAGAKRTRKQAAKQIAEAVRRTTDELVIEPVASELEQRAALLGHLVAAGARA